jgi:hypothetical protein
LYCEYPGAWIVCGGWQQIGDGFCQIGACYGLWSDLTADIQQMQQSTFAVVICQVWYREEVLVTRTTCRRGKSAGS